jgi:ankyrin repeat protein
MLCARCLSILLAIAIAHWPVVSAAYASDRCAGLELPEGETAEAVAKRGNPNKRNYAYGRNFLTCLAASRKITDEDKVRAARVQVDRNVDLSLIDDNGDTALHLAVVSNSPELAKFLMDSGADADAVNMLGFSPLQLAMKSRAQAIIDTFSTRGRFVDNRDNQGRTPLFDAASRGDLAVVRQLIARGADVRASDKNALTGAALKGHVPVVRYLIREAKLPVDVPSSDGETALMAAAAANRIDMARLLIEEFGAAQEKISPRGFTALSLAATAGHVNMIRYLLAHGATDGGSHPSALSAASMAGRLGAVNALIDLGADLGAGSPDRPGVLFWAALGGNEDVLQTLVKRGVAFPQFPVESGPLVRAVVNRHYARGLLAKDSYQEAMPYLRDAISGYDAIALTLESQAKELSATAFKEELKIHLFSVFVSAVGAYAAQYQQQQNMKSIAQVKALGEANRAGTGTSGYFRYYDDYYNAMQRSRVQNNAAPIHTVPIASPTSSNVQSSAPRALVDEWGHVAATNRAQSDALQELAKQYRRDSKATSAMLECATVATSGAAVRAGRCL